MAVYLGTFFLIPPTFRLPSFGGYYNYEGISVGPRQGSTFLLLTYPRRVLWHINSGFFALKIMILVSTLLSSVTIFSALDYFCRLRKVVVVLTPVYIFIYNIIFIYLFLQRFFLSYNNVLYLIWTNYLLNERYYIIILRCLHNGTSKRTQSKYTASTIWGF